MFGDEILSLLLPMLQERLNSNRWQVKEAALLALGAAAGGTINGMVPFLPKLVESLLKIVEDRTQHVLVVASACWTLSRLSSWIVRSGNEYLDRLVRVMCGLLASNSRRVQEGSCSCLSVVAEETWAVSKRKNEFNVALAQFVGPILTNLMRVYPRYEAKNVLILYDCVANCLEGLAPQHANAVCNTVVPPMMAFWKSMDNAFDRRVIPLLECMATVIIAVRGPFGQYAGPVLQRALNLAHAQMKLYLERQSKEKDLRTELLARSVTDTEADDVIRNRLGVVPYDLDFCSVALDLAGAMCSSGLLGPLQQSLGGPIVALMRDSMSCVDDTVRKAAFALCGDLAQDVPELVVPVGNNIIPLILDNLLGSFTALCINASWALGSLCDRLGPNMSHAPQLVQRLQRLLMKDHDSQLLRNVAIVLSRIAQYFPQVVSAALPEVCAYWLVPLAQVKFGGERDRAHTSALLVLRGNLPVALQQLPRICSLLHSWGDTPMPPPIRQAARDLLISLKQSPDFTTRWNAVPADDQLFVQKMMENGGGG